MEAAEILAKSKKGYLIAPAGCGKTHLIAEAIGRFGGGHELILTHTHAGVDALRRKLSNMNVSASSFHIDTIAGWALRYAASFPKSSGLSITMPVQAQWDETYKATTILLKDSCFQRIIKASYSGVYVDEYQDCTILQHTLILALANLIPCRILGDPLQGIFDFGENIPFNWEHDVVTNFKRLPELTKPWRWLKTNQELGKWLSQVRTEILAGRAVDLRKAPGSAVRWIQLPARNFFREQYLICSKVTDQQGMVVAIHHPLAEPQCNNLARQLGGSFAALETIECRDLLMSAEGIDKTQKIDRVIKIIKFASMCLTKVSTELKPLSDAFGKGRIPAKFKHKLVLEGCMNVINNSNSKVIMELLEAIKNISGVKIVRRELFYEMNRALRAFGEGGFSSLRDAAWHVRDLTRREGRVMGRRNLGRTLLIKGLEFDEAIVLNASVLDAKNLYVALTRGSKFLTVLSTIPVLGPFKLSNIIT